MAQIQIGISMEFVRHHDIPFGAGVEKAAAIGYKFIEPMVHLGRELMSEAGYFHTMSMCGWSGPVTGSFTCMPRTSVSSRVRMNGAR
jgi:hypothetical protein